MFYTAEVARTPKKTPVQAADTKFAGRLYGKTDAVYLDGARTRVLAATGLPFVMPVCDQLRREPVLASLLAEQHDLLFDFSAGAVCRTPAEEIILTPAQTMAAAAALRRVAEAPGKLNANGELELDLKTEPVGPHYNVNLLLGWRAGYTAPLFTTPKSSVDSLGRGAFRAGGPKQVLASRCVLQPEDAGEPVNRQFYLYEDGKKIFYSLDVHTNVKSAHCIHSQNRTTITYETEDGLRITRTIFLAMQQQGMPDALEIQHIKIDNRGKLPRTLKIVLTGEFGIAAAETVANDVIYANVVHQSETLYDENGRPVCLTLHHKPADQQGEKKFALLLADGETMDDFGCNYAEFVGNGTLADPELGNCLPSRPHRKLAPFFAMDKTFTVAAGQSKTVDEFVGMMDRDHDVTTDFDAAIHTLVTAYAQPGTVEKELAKVEDFQKKYTSYLTPATGDQLFDAYVGKTCPSRCCTRPLSPVPLPGRRNPTAKPASGRSRTSSPRCIT